MDSGFFGSLAPAAPRAGAAANSAGHELQEDSGWYNPDQRSTVIG